MAYCVQCGNQVGEADQFCGKCGSRQASAPGARSAPLWPRGNHAFSNISARHAALFCYVPILGWIAAIIVLAADRFRHDHRVRFHAFQGLYLFAAWLLVDWLISPVLMAPAFGRGFQVVHAFESILKLVIMGAWIVGMIRVSQDQDYHLPILGELAEKSVSEQRS